METVSESRNRQPKEAGRFGRFFSNFFGAEILANRRMRPWYLYFLFVFLLVIALVFSEQQIRAKEKEITALENTYKMEISRLKANNQFIPYEKNRILIRKMEERGYVTTDDRCYTVKATPEKAEKRRRFRRKEGRHADK